MRLSFFLWNFTIIDHTLIGICQRGVLISILSASLVRVIVFRVWEYHNWRFREYLEREKEGSLVPVSSDRWAPGLIPRGDDFLSQCVSVWDRVESCATATTILSSILAERKREREGNASRWVERGRGRREDGRKPRFISFQKGSASLASGEKLSLLLNNR